MFVVHSDHVRYDVYSIQVMILRRPQLMVGERAKGHRALQSPKCLLVEKGMGPWDRLRLLAGPIVRVSQDRVFWMELDWLRHGTLRPLEKEFLLLVEMKIMGSGAGLTLV